MAFISIRSTERSSDRTGSVRSGAYLAERLSIHICAALLLAAASLVVSLWSIRRNFEGGVTFEFCQYAEIGRNILEGKGYRTRAINPYILSVLDAKGVPFDGGHLAPVLDRFPLQSYATAAAEALAGQDDFSVAALSTVALASCVVLTFLVGSWLFSPWEAAFAAALMAFNPTFQRGFVLWGLPDFGFCLCTLAVLALICRDEDKAWYWAVSGAVAGAQWLARSNAILWAPIYLWMARSTAKPGARTSGAIRALLLLLAMAAVAAPGWIYNLHWFGSINPPTLPWDLALYVTQPDYPALSYKSLSSSEIVLRHFPALLRKFRIFLFWHIRDLPTMWQMQCAFPFAVLGIYRTLCTRWGEENADAPLRRFVACALAMLALQLVVFSAIRYETLGPYAKGRYFLWFAPAAFLLAARGASSLGRWAKASDKGGMLVVGSLNLLFFLSYLAMPRAPWAHPMKMPASEWPEIYAAAHAAGSDGLVATNFPTQMAWYGRRSSIALPNELDDFIAIGRRHPIDAILISRLGMGGFPPASIWESLASDRNILEKFCRANGFRVFGDFGSAVVLQRAGEAGPGRR